MKTIYTTDDGFSFEKKEDAERWENNSPVMKLKRLIVELEEALNIPNDTIATCSMQSLQIKNMVRVCGNFYEDHKNYLNYY